MSVLRAREAKTAATYGSARWATPSEKRHDRRCRAPPVTGAVFVMGQASGGVVACVVDHVGMGCAPDVALRLGQANQLLDDPQPRAVADHVRMAGEVEDAALLIGRLELAPEHVEHIRRRR